jgi:gluconolactonase
MTRTIRELARGLRFPEGPILLPDGSVLVVEIAAGRLTRVARDGATEVVAMPGGGPNGAAIGPDGRCYVCNNGGFEWTGRDGRLYPRHEAPDWRGGRIDVVDLRTGSCSVLYGPDSVEGGLKAPNDLVFDAHGGFWFTDHGHLHAHGRDRGAVCYATPDGRSIARVVHSLDTPNGIGLSPDGRTLYVAETVTARLWAFDVTAPGRIDRTRRNLLGHPGRLLAGLGGLHLFDSLAVDPAGRIIVATMPGQLTIVAPDGRIVDRVDVPDEVLVTNLCLDPADPLRAVVTLSSTGRLVEVVLPAGCSAAAAPDPVPRDAHTQCQAAGAGSAAGAAGSDSPVPGRR